MLPLECFLSTRGNLYAHLSFLPAISVLYSAKPQNISDKKYSRILISYGQKQVIIEHLSTQFLNAARQQSWAPDHTLTVMSSPKIGERVPP